MINDGCKGAPVEHNKGAQKLQRGVKEAQGGTIEHKGCKRGSRSVRGTRGYKRGFQ